VAKPFIPFTVAVWGIIGAVIALILYIDRIEEWATTFTEKLQHWRPSLRSRRAERPASPHREVSGAMRSNTSLYSIVEPLPAYTRPPSYASRHSPFPSLLSFYHASSISIDDASPLTEQASISVDNSSSAPPHHPPLRVLTVPPATDVHNPQAALTYAPPPNNSIS
jgi:hypothetical protein